MPDYARTQQGWGEHEGRASVISAWEQEIGPVSRECMARLARAPVSQDDARFQSICVYCPLGATPEECEGAQGFACISFRRGDVIAVAEDASVEELLPHELTHLLAACELGDADSSHTDSRLWHDVQQVARWFREGHGGRAPSER